jgi:hypothetical protein
MQRAFASKPSAATVRNANLRRVNPFVGVLLGSSVAACSILTSLNGLTGGAPDEGAPSSADAAVSPVSLGEDASAGCLTDACHASAPPSEDEAGDARVASDVDAMDSSDASPSSIARVQSVAPDWVSDEAATLTLVQENAGDLLVAGVYFSASSVTVTVTDSLGNTWLPTTAYANTAGCSAGNVTVAQIFYAGSIAAGSNTVTVAQSSGTSPLGVFLVEYSGASSAGVLDGVNGGPATSSTGTMSAGTLTTTGAHDLVVGLFAEATVYGLMAPGPGFSIVANSTTFYSLFEDDLPAGMGPGPVTPTAIEPGDAPSDCWVAATAAFKPGP